MSLAHFDDIYDICHEAEKDGLFGKKFRSEGTTINKYIIKSSDLGKKDIIKRFYLV